MLNPWLTLPFQAVRLGWETQSIMANQMMRLAGIGCPDRKAAANLVPEAAPPPVAETPVVPTSPVAATVQAAAPAKSAKPRQLAEKVKKAQKQRSLRANRRRSK